MLDATRGIDNLEVGGVSLERKRVSWKAGAWKLRLGSGFMGGHDLLMGVGMDHRSVRWC